jgi:transposase
MSRFPSAAHLISWAGICPRNDESTGKRRSKSPAQGRYLAQDHGGAMLLGAAIKKKGSYVQAQYHRIKARRCPKKAIMAVAACILTAIYHMLKGGTMYQDLGGNHFNRKKPPDQTPS